MGVDGSLAVLATRQQQQQQPTGEHGGGTMPHPGTVDRHRSGPDRTLPVFAAPN